MTGKREFLIASAGLCAGSLLSGCVTTGPQHGNGAVVSAPVNATRRGMSATEMAEAREAMAIFDAMSQNKFRRLPLGRYLEQQAESLKRDIAAMPQVLNDVAMVEIGRRLKHVVLTYHQAGSRDGKSNSKSGKAKS